MITPANVGIIGCGNISGIYLENSRMFDALNVVAVADIDPDRAQARAAEYNVPKACSVEELLADPDIEIVINLTTPDAHGPVALAALNAGKHVYNEKPLAVTRDEARALLDLAERKGLRVGCAPDTFLGGGLQTCRKLIDDGWIGEPIGATAFMMSHGPESWHPNPTFFYQPGGGPMFDMGPYYLTALCVLLGPVRRVTGSARISFAERTVTGERNYGATIPVNTPTHVAGVLDFASGAVATIITSFDVWSSQLPRIEIYGSHGTLSVPDPNTFDGPVLLRRAGAREWSSIPLSHGFTRNSRGIGVADMATAIRTDRPHRASGELAYHVLDIMHAIHDASREERHILLRSAMTRPKPLPLGLGERGVDAE
ncbi:Gfo/Idh/MocA family protein [Roseiflexus castenholzii]|jgi:predicted dehydrogenase|uniref:Oxidoreductase domain protein n=1 Tax=Roseiflexus castenholzii (strain DSM 13941 / HLO8) TaxID=383372 RepID=A7NS75_ROSCS|nr:Gfo/Idh/MocA family oxidoreductase [Roseiflexus castenholzii]ABU60421.1 oxidoreductase domain protein [Roseiflexus castenholzii DSM 13941]